MMDLSNNMITELEQWTVDTVEELNLENNFIRFIGVDVFERNSSSLSVLKLSNNQISHLPEGCLKSLSLRELQLANNTLSSLSWSTFEGQFNLETLDLSGNILMSSGLPANLSQYLPNLLQLNLCSNQLENLPSEFTSFLANLQVIIKTYLGFFLASFIRAKNCCFMSLFNNFCIWGAGIRSMYLDLDRILADAKKCELFQ